MKIKLESIKKSTRKGKKLMATFELTNSEGTKKENHVVHFGAEGSSTFIDHKDKQKKKNWLLRHAGYIQDAESNMSPSILSWLILWNKENIKDSIADYKKRSGY